MDGHHALRINNIKALTESLLGDLQAPGAEPSDEAARWAHAWICFKLAEIRETLADAATMSGVHGDEIPVSANTAMEVANLLVAAFAGGDHREPPVQVDYGAHVRAAKVSVN